jgi:hypothetical protein
MLTLQGSQLPASRRQANGAQAAGPQCDQGIFSDSDEDSETTRFFAFGLRVRTHFAGPTIDRFSTAYTPLGDIKHEEMRHKWRHGPVRRKFVC